MIGSRKTPLGVLAVAAALAAIPAPAAADHGILELLSPGTGEFDTTFGGATADGGRAFFTTPEPLVADDVDARHDVYERSGERTTLVSVGADVDDAGFVGATPDGSHVLFVTAQRLSPDDTDNVADIYDRTGGQTVLVTAGGNQNTAPFFRAISDDGKRVFFDTTEPIAGAGDPDSKRDLYVRASGQTTLLSSGGDGSADVFFRGISRDGSRAFVETDDPLITAEDTDGAADVYEITGGVVKAVSPMGSGNFDARFRKATPDGTHVWFTTPQPISVVDADTTDDVYERAADQTTLVSRGGNGGFAASVCGASADGSRVIFRTADRLVTADTDSASDIYERSAGRTVLLSGGNGAFSAVCGAVSDDGTRVFFTTLEPLVETDTDAFVDLYERSNGQTSLVSPGTELDNVSYEGISADGARVFFNTADRIAGTGDTDTGLDLYERAAGQTTLLSGGSSQLGVSFNRSSDDGQTVFFTTSEALPGTGDSDTRIDVYVARSGTPATPAPPAQPADTSADAPPAAPDEAVVPGPGARVDSDAPVITGAALAPKRFAVRRVKGSRARVGSRLRLSLSEAAELSIAIDRVGAGRRVGSRCVRPTQANRRRRACVRLTPQGKLASQQPAGTVELPFRGKVGRRTLGPGRYRATLIATDGAGNRSRPVELTFTVVRR